MQLFSIIKPFLFKIDPEKAHNLAIKALKLGIYPSVNQQNFPKLQQNIAGLNFNLPVGLAAGFDKNAEAIKSLARYNFGFLEVGTVTKILQQGNDKPRLFRLSEDEAIINRMGFNNVGYQTFCTNLRDYRRSKNIKIGANIGINKNSINPIADYKFMISKLYNLCDYITINISSPNTPGLRDLQKKEMLEELLAGIAKKRDEIQQFNNSRLLIFLKIAPDLSDQEIEDIAELVLKHKLTGLIISNTTISRPDSLQSEYKGEKGGLSGAPLFELSNEALSKFYKATKGSIPLIGVGGIRSSEDAYTKIRNGASLVQIYTGLIYHGIELVSEINHGLNLLVERDGYNNISEAIGADIKL